MMTGVVGNRMMAGAQYLACRYAKLPQDRVVMALATVVTEGLATWATFPPPSELVARMDRKLLPPDNSRLGSWIWKGGQRVPLD